jgi:hypothetical protein
MLTRSEIIMPAAIQPTLACCWLSQSTDRANEETAQTTVIRRRIRGHLPFKNLNDSKVLYALCTQDTKAK